MSEANASEYRVVALPRNFSHWPYSLTDGLYRTVDLFRSEAAAYYSARILNEGRAYIDNHAPVGCRVMPR